VEEEWWSHAGCFRDCPLSLSTITQTAPPYVPSTVHRARCLLGPLTLPTPGLSPRVKVIQSSKWCWENWVPTCEMIKLVPYLTPHTKISTKYFKDLNVRPKSIKLLGKKIGGELHDIGLGRLLEYDTKTQAIKEKRDK